MLTIDNACKDVVYIWWLKAIFYYKRTFDRFSRTISQIQPDSSFIHRKWVEKVISTFMPILLIIYFTFIVLESVQRDNTPVFITRD